MLRALLLSAFLIVTGLGSVYAFLGIGEETRSWEEDVTLVSGRRLSVKRTIIIGSDEWGRKGRGSLQKQSITFLYDGKSVEWSGDDIRPIWYSPAILELVDGDPVIVIPAYDWGPCFKFNFPQEGLIAYRFSNGQWLSTPIQKLPSDLKVNLLRGTQYDGLKIDATAKMKYEGRGLPPKLGNTIPELIKHYADIENSCSRMRPPSNVNLENARQRNSDAERIAPNIQADVQSIQTDPEVITSAAFREQKGDWTGVGYLTEGCKGIVERIEPLRQWRGDQNRYDSRLIGYQLVLTTPTPDKQRIQIADDGRALLHCVLCDETAIFAVRTIDRSNLIIHRFSHDGELMDAFRVSLPDPVRVIPGSPWGSLWSVVSDSKGSLAISVADYNYPQLANLGGTIKKKVTYKARLPEVKLSSSSNSALQATLRDEAARRP